LLCTHLAYKRLGCGMDSLIIGVAIVAALYIVARLALRFYFPPDT
jgi:hypothetical protein